MLGIAQKLAEVKRRIAETEERIAEERARLDERSSVEPTLSAVVLVSTEDTLRQLKCYEARLEDLIALNAGSRRS